MHGERIVQERRTARSHRYLALRATVELTATAVADVDRRQEATAREQQRLETQVAQVEAQARFFGGERGRLIALLAATPGFRDIQTLQRDLESARREVADAAEAEIRARRVLQGQRALLDTLLGQDARDLRAAYPVLAAEGSVLGLADEPPSWLGCGRRLLTTAPSPAAIWRPGPDGSPGRPTRSRSASRGSMRW